MHVVDNNKDTLHKRKMQRVGNSSSSTIACNALAIVLQHWLIPPDLSLPGHNLESHLPDLLEEIVLKNRSLRIIFMENIKEDEIKKQREKLINNWESLATTDITKSKLEEIEERLQDDSLQNIIPMGAVLTVSLDFSSNIVPISCLWSIHRVVGGHSLVRM